MVEAVLMRKSWCPMATSVVVAGPQWREGAGPAFVDVAVIPMDRGGPTRRIRLSPVFDRRDPRGHERVRLKPIEHAVVDGERHIAHRPHFDRRLPALVSDYRPLLQLSDAQDRRLRLRNDDRCGD